VKPFADHFSTIASAYAVFRPQYPDALFDFLAQVAPARDAAWDAGTGSGQAAVGLARHFAHVIATDASEAQIEHAAAHPNVQYRVATAEASGVADGAVDVVTAAQAIHWFDPARFWSEVRRVLRPRGVVAVWAYDVVELDSAVDAVVRRFYTGVVGPFWAPERQLVEQRYRTIDFPFDELPAPDFTIERPISIDELGGYVRTWSATHAYIAHHGHDPVDQLMDEIARTWGDRRQRRLARWPIALRLGRVP
jgi:SAM-dependent methyltransferase